MAELLGRRVYASAYRASDRGDDMTTILFILGLVLLWVLLIDVHMTVFVPRGGAGIIARRLYSGTWGVWLWLGNRFFTGERCR